MKVGIISEFKFDTVNYGNQLQAYALNYFLRNHLGIENVESIALGPKQLIRYTKVWSATFAGKVLGTLWDKIAVKLPTHREQNAVDRRKCQQKFQNFQKKIPVCKRQFCGGEIRNMDYDVMIVGSDVVWGQNPLYINRTKFLDFEAKKPFRRIAYAASFGRDYIPKENVKYIRKYLARFDAISVREHSSVAMLNDIGVQNVSYCLDPTLLLTKQEWDRLEEKPEEIADGEKYVFTYLLGGSARQREEITIFANNLGTKIVTIPYANGYFIEADETFGDIRLQDGSVGNWLWLIHHAEYVITDSFHGTVFSTIYQKRFVVLPRESTVNINNRMQDYLREVGQSDKVLLGDGLSDVENLVWDYTQIGEAIEIRRRRSIEFLKNVFGEKHG